MKPITHLVSQAVKGTISRDEIESYRSSASITNDEIWNTLALSIARSFDSERLSYEDADTAMNKIHTYMIDDAAKFGDGFELAEPAFSIYQAFDEGEYDHGGSKDPVE